MSKGLANKRMTTTEKDIFIVFFFKLIYLQMVLLIFHPYCGHLLGFNLPKKLALTKLLTGLYIFLNLFS